MTLDGVADVLRIIAYTVATIGCLYLTFDDRVQGRNRWLLWLALAAEHGAVLVLLSLDVGRIAAFMDSRVFLTPTAIIASIAVAIYAYQRWQWHREMRRKAESMTLKAWDSLG